MQTVEQRGNIISFIENIYQTDANFVLVKVDDAVKRYDQLIERGIVIRNRTTQPMCENTLRFTIGTKNENKLFAGQKILVRKKKDLYFIGDDNFIAITKYNISHFYAMAVYYLSEELKK